MARGRTLFSEHSRRAISVPVEDLSYPDATTTTKLHHIRSGAFHDADALTSASKRHDREFLHRVQSTLATPPTLIKTPPTLSHHRGLRPPPSRSAYYVAAASSAASSAAASSAPHDLRRRTWYGPTANRVDDYEVDAYLATPARPPYVSRSLRSGSVPPVLPSASSSTGLHHWVPTSHAREVSVSRWTPPTYRTYGSGRSHLHSDLDAFGTGSSHHRHSAFDAQHDLDSVDDYPRIPVATRVTSPYFAYRSSPLQGTHEDLDFSPYHQGGSRYPKYGGRSSSVSSYSSSSFTQPTHAAATPARFSTLGYSTRASSARRPPVDSTEFDLDLDLSRSRAPVRSLPGVHHRTSSSLDRHLSTESRIGGSFSTGGGGGSSSHGRSGSALVVGLSGSSHSLPPVAPLPSAPAPPSLRASKPQISETRQRVRDLLCKSKKDPHYFD